MTFKDKLNEYLKKLNITSKTLSEKTNISQSVISRYRSGERTPLKESKQLEAIINTINEINTKQNQIIKEGYDMRCKKRLPQIRWNRRTQSKYPAASRRLLQLRWQQP